MDIEVGTFEAKNRLSELLTLVGRGQRVYITRRGKRVALLTSVAEDVDRRSDAEELRARFRMLRKAAGRGKESLKALVEEGRR
jgi:prevent-host-death family protein